MTELVGLYRKTERVYVPEDIHENGLWNVFSPKNKRFQEGLTSKVFSGSWSSVMDRLEEMEGFLVHVGEDRYPDAGTLAYCCGGVSPPIRKKNPIVYDFEKRDKIPVQIRWLIRRDFEAVLDISSRSYEDPLNGEDLSYLLRQRTCIGMVAENDSIVNGNRSRILGSIIYNLNESRLECFDLAVDPEFRRRSIGNQLFDKMSDKLSLVRRNELFFNMEEDNLVGLNFLKARGSIIYDEEDIHSNYFEDENNPGMYVSRYLL